MPQPPLRHSKSLQVAPEAQPAALLLVDVLTATNVATTSAPQDQQQEAGASDVQQMQQIVCGVMFEDTLNNAHTGDSMIWRLPYAYAFTLQSQDGCLRCLLAILAFSESQTVVVGNGRLWGCEDYS